MTKKKILAALAAVVVISAFIAIPIVWGGRLGETPSDLTNLNADRAFDPSVGIVRPILLCLCHQARF